MGAAGSGQGDQVGFRLSQASPPATAPPATAPPRRILYGRRLGRPLRPIQRRRLDDMLPRLALSLPPAGRQLDPAGLFDPPKSALWMEIGFGGGEHLAAQAARHPEIGFIGCEPFLNGVAQLLAHIEAGGLTNIRIHPDDARAVLDALPDGALGRLYVLFPDPWPKARHHRRRFIGPGNLPAIARVLAAGAELRTATDDPDYLAWMCDHLNAYPALSALAAGAGAGEPWPDWPGTRYDAKARAAGRAPVFLAYRRRDEASEKA